MFSQDIFGDLKLSESIAVDLISKSATNNCFTHAYLFTGYNLKVTRTLVDIFSKIILCESRTANDNCLSCRVFDSKQHPDYIKCSPDIDKSKFITIEQIRELIIENQRYPVTSKQKVLYIEQANAMNDVSSNAILKTLEEPASFVTVILNTDSIDNILSTIISRCQTIPVKSPIDFEYLPNFEFRQYIPKSFSDADDMANKLGKADKEEIKIVILNLQKSIWNETKITNFSEEDLRKKIYILSKLEEYYTSIESYVNLKLILENMFIDLFRVRKIF